METKTQKKQEAGMEPQENSKTRKAAERIAISKEASDRLDQWVEELEKQAKGIRVTRADVADFILLSHSPALSGEEVAKLEDSHFDDVKFSFWIARTLQRKRANGESVSFEQLYKQHRKLPS